MSYTAIELDISQKILEKDVTWFPNRRWLKLQAVDFEKEAEAGEDVSTEERLARMDVDLRRTNQQLEAVVKLLEEQREVHEENRNMLQMQASTKKR